MNRKNMPFDNTGRRDDTIYFVIIKFIFIILLDFFYDTLRKDVHYFIINSQSI